MSALCLSGKPGEADALMMNLLERFEQEQAMVGESSSATSMLVKPDTIAFSNLMEGWKNNMTAFPNGTDRVLELLQLMKDWQARGYDDMAPNGRTYTTVLSCLAKSRTWDACLQAKEMLQEIPGGPATIHCNAVLDAFSKSPRADKAHHAKALLEEMIQTDDCPPDLISFNSVVGAAAGSFGNSDLKKESLAIATAIFKHMCQSEDLDPSPYNKIVHGVAIPCTCPRLEVVSRVVNWLRVTYKFTHAELVKVLGCDDPTIQLITGWGNKVFVVRGKVERAKAAQG